MVGGKLSKKAIILMERAIRKKAGVEEVVNTPIAVVIAQDFTEASEILGGTLKGSTVNFFIEKLEKDEAWEKIHSFSNTLTFARKEAPDVMLVFRDGVMIYGDMTEEYWLKELPCFP
jgi:hypothetical protein